ncbi:tRNA adenosine(34) deaminase TadA [Clostridium tunisiense]|uniref:tRNA adenosine(34) deaminase TadA n=1 Tax=Clostridium tunisiense TaxID=219748 RepID=UPI0002F141C2|nr:tRNA adenosine(34) deaminase TadA [Clostridium tunisiense]
MENSHMKMAIEEAKKALERAEVPVGAVIVKDDKVISVAHNLKEGTKDPTNHAEIIAIRKASEVLGRWRLNDCSMYVTLEPCAMCAGAIIQSRIKTLYIGTFDPRAGACGSVFNITQDHRLNHWVNVKWLYDEECSNLLQEFFIERRK